MTFKYFLDVGDDNAFGAEDDITADVISAEWRIGLRNSQVRLADENMATLVMNNTTGKYTPENPASPLYGKLHPRKRLRIMHDDLPLWTGWLMMPQVAYAASGVASGMTTATLIGVVGKQLLEQLPARLPLYTTVTAETILTDIFSDYLLPPTIADVWRLGDSAMSDLGDTTTLGSIADFANFDTGKFVFEVFGDTAYDDLWAVIHHLVQSERGYFFFNRDGRAVFWNRHHIHAPIVPSATINGNNEFAPQQVAYRYGDGLVNEVWVESQPRRLNAEAVLWSLDSPVTLAPYQQVVLEARLRKDGGQYVGAGGGLVANPTFSQGSASISITPLGGKALITLKNSTSQTAILTNLTLQGISSARQNALAVVAEDMSSQAQYGRFGMKIKLGSPANALEISSIAQYEVLARATPMGKIDKMSYIESAITAHPQRLLWTLGDALRVQLAELHHDATYIIIGEVHVVEGTTHRTEYILLQQGLPFWTLTATGYAELGETTVVGY
ncbi:MAG: hypothetical protein SFZ02_11280 [bacterium]|nr:hypothetical protein [bacterium]